MSNFAILLAEFPTVHEAAVATERHAAGDPTAAAFFAGEAVEVAVTSIVQATVRTTWRDPESPCKLHP